MNAVIDISKASRAFYQWANQLGLVKDKKPRKPTVNGQAFNPKSKAFGGNETMLERAKSRNLLDIWTPKVTFKFAASQSQEFTGKRAQSLWKEWNARQFGKKKGKK